MKLYMSSYKIGNKIDYLNNWIKNNDNKIAVIPNALDHHNDIKVREFKINEKLDDLLNVGFVYEIIDLRDYFNIELMLFKKLRDFNAVYVLGGNTFVLRRAMKLSGFDCWINIKKHDENFLYSGFSAGICVLSDYMYGLDIVDDKNIDPYNSGFTLYEGLGVIDFVPVPHYKSNHPESVLVDDTIKYLEDNNVRYKTIRDGEVLIEEV